MTSKLVYTTQHGELCARCGRAPAICICPGTRKPAPPPPGHPKDGVVRVASQTKGRKGKGVTLVTGVPLDASALEALGKELKVLCGSGGTVKDGVIELQGDHRDRVVAELTGRGYRVKRAGG